MFNVYPVELRYKRVKRSGVLAGIPLTCSFGVESRAVAERYQQVFENKSSEEDRFFDFEIVEKR